MISTLAKHDNKKDGHCHNHTNIGSTHAFLVFVHLKEERVRLPWEIAYLRLREQTVFTCVIDMLCVD